MSLETYETSEQLYLARAAEVNSLRPVFTGDVFSDVAIPGVQDAGMAAVIAHPCTMRGKNAQLEERILVAAVQCHEQVRAAAWVSGFYDFMPLPDLVEDDELYVVRLSDIGKGLSTDLSTGRRLACLSPFGVNLLLQRFIWLMARHEVPTFQLHETLAHTFEEADLFEEWSDIVCDADMSAADAAALFDAFLRVDRGGGLTYQANLRDPQRRSSVRSACRAEARRVVEQ